MGEGKKLKTYDIGRWVIDESSWFCVGKGFGYEKSEGEWKHRKHSFKVKIGDNVFIGNGTNIDIGRWRDTVINDGTKIDSLVHVGHNVVVGRNCLIVSGSILGGSCEIGDGCFLGMGCMIRDGVKIGSGSFIGMGSVVIHDIPSNSTVYGNPAKITERKNDYVNRHVFGEMG